jgi:hypothetical protein
MSPEKEKLACTIASMNRESLARMLREMQCGFPMDFTDEYLDSLSLERLQHIVLAAYINSKQSVPAWAAM